MPIIEQVWPGSGFTCLVGTFNTGQETEELPQLLVTSLRMPSSSRESWMLRDTFDETGIDLATSVVFGDCSTGKEGLGDSTVWRPVYDSKAELAAYDWTVGTVQMRGRIYSFQGEALPIGANKPKPVQVSFVFVGANEKSPTRIVWFTTANSPAGFELEGVTLQKGALNSSSYYYDGGLPL